MTTRLKKRLEENLAPVTYANQDQITSVSHKVQIDVNSSLLFSLFLAHEGNIIDFKKLVEESQVEVL